MGKYFDAALDLLEQVSPATPAAGRLRFFAKADHKLYIKDSTGLETQIGAGGGGATWTSVEADVTAAVTSGMPCRCGRFTITDAAITALSKVVVVQSGRAISTKGTRGDENEMDSIRCHAESGAGAATVHWTSQTFVKGLFEFDYQIG